MIGRVLMLTDNLTVTPELQYEKSSERAFEGSIPEDVHFENMWGYSKSLRIGMTPKNISCANHAARFNYLRSRAHQSCPFF